MQEIIALFGHYPELLLAADDAKKRVNSLQTKHKTLDHAEVSMAEMDYEKAITEVENCRHDAATAWMWAFRCAREFYPELGNVFNELLPTPGSSVWDSIGV